MMPDADAFLTWLYLPTHFMLAWTAAGFDLMAGRPPVIDEPAFQTSDIPEVWIS